jgi:hypothetical protein
LNTLALEDSRSLRFSIASGPPHGPSLARVAGLAIPGFAPSQSLGAEEPKRSAMLGGVTRAGQASHSRKQPTA